MTWIEVVDSAIKIGLGGLIGGFFALWSAKSNHDRESVKSFKNFQRELYMKASAELTQLHHDLIIGKDSVYSDEKRHEHDDSLPKRCVSIESILILAGDQAVIKDLRVYVLAASDITKHFRETPEYKVEDKERTTLYSHLLDTKYALDARLAESLKSTFLSARP